MSIFNFLVSKTIMHVPGPIVKFFAKDYIAGKEAIDAVKESKKLNSKKMRTTIDILGESISKEEEASIFKDSCMQLLDSIHQENLDSGHSLKATQLGLALEKELALKNIREIVKKAKSLGIFVRLDMENSPYTTDTLEIYSKLQKEYKHSIGAVLQAYLRRTPKDIDSLDSDSLNIRLCKGIYDEKRKIAYKDTYIINRSFIYCLEKLFKKGAYIGIATHDEKLVFEALRLIKKYNLSKEQYEFQMLLGVDEELREIILNDGHNLRIYVPFGKDWLPYCKRRLKENPNIARHSLRQMFGIHGHKW